MNCIIIKQRVQGFKVAKSSMKNKTLVNILNVFDDNEEELEELIKTMRERENVVADGQLETIPEVPNPEKELWGLKTKDGKIISCDCWPNLCYFSDETPKSYCLENSDYDSLLNRKFLALIKLVGSPFIPTTIMQPQIDHLPSWTVGNSSLEVAKARYILHQYIAASGGQAALNSVKSMYVVGQMKLLGPEETHQADDSLQIEGKHKAGSFVLCRQYPNLWYLEMVVHGFKFKFNSGSDGIVSWFQSSWKPHKANRESPRLLRRLFQGLDPGSTAKLFSNAVSVGEKTVKNQECFVLKLQIAPTTLRMQSSPNTEIVNYSIWGYFSQKTGLLIQLTDVILLRTNVTEENDDAFWAICIESQMEDYRQVDGIYIAHGGKTYARLDKYGDKDSGRWKMEEKWRIEDVDFNIHGLSMENFLPPGSDIVV